MFRSLSPIEPSQVVRGQYDGYLDEPGVRAALRDRDVHRAALRDRQLALGRRAVLPAHRQAHGRRARASSRSRSASRPRACSRPAPASARTAPTTSRSTSPTRRGSRCRSTASGPGPGMTLDKQSLQFALHETGPDGRPARGVRAADLRRDERRPHAVHERRRHRAPVGAVEAAAREPAAGAAVPARLVGTERDPPADRARRVAAPVRAGLAPDLTPQTSSGTSYCAWYRAKRPRSRRDRGRCPRGSTGAAPRASFGRAARWSTIAVAEPGRWVEPEPLVDAADRCGRIGHEVGVAHVDELIVGKTRPWRGRRSVSSSISP